MSDATSISPRCWFALGPKIAFGVVSVAVVGGDNMGVRIAQHWQGSCSRLAGSVSMRHFAMVQQPWQPQCANHRKETDHLSPKNWLFRIKLSPDRPIRSRCPQ